MRRTSALNESGETTSVLVPTCPCVSAVIGGVRAAALSVDGLDSFVFSNNAFADWGKGFCVASSFGEVDRSVRGFSVVPMIFP